MVKHRIKKIIIKKNHLITNLKNHTSDLESGSEGEGSDDEEGKKKRNKKPIF